MTTSQAWCPDPAAAAADQGRKQLLGGGDNTCLPGSLAHLGHTPLIITGIIRQVLIHLFANSNFIEDPALRSAVWRDGSTTSILIETVHNWRPDTVELRPAVLLKRNAYRNVRIAIDDRLGADEQGFDHYTTIWVGSTTLFCIHGTGASTEILATEAQRQLTQFGPAIGQQLALKRFQVVDVGEVSEVEEATENFVAPVTVGWAYDETWKIERESLLLQGISIELPQVVG